MSSTLMNVVQADPVKSFAGVISPFDVHAFSRPARMFTGDFYFTHHDDDRLWFALGDVSGKGLRAALIMEMIQEELDHLIASCVETQCDPVRTMQRVHDFLFPLLPGNRFATMVVGYATSDGTVELVNAGHCFPLVVRRSGKIESVDSTGPVAGLLPGSKWSSRTLRLEPGERLVLYTDGLLEASSSDGAEFGQKGLEESLTSQPLVSSRQLTSAIVESVDCHAEGRREDDLTVLVVTRL